MSSLMICPDCGDRTVSDSVWVTEDFTAIQRRDCPHCGQILDVEFVPTGVSTRSFEEVLNE